MHLLFLILFLLLVPGWQAHAADSRVGWQCATDQNSNCNVSEANPLPVAITAAAGNALANQASADSVSNLTFTAANKTLSTLTIKIGATSGYVMLFDAAALPSNGAVTPKWCVPVVSNGTNGGLSALWQTPLLFTTGVTAGFSTTGCDTLTASATAKFMGQAS